MANALNPTPGRVALFRSIVRGDVSEEWYNDEPGEINATLFARQVCVTGKVRVMKAAGLCETSTDDNDLHVREIVPTVAGREWLAAAEREV